MPNPQITMTVDGEPVSINVQQWRAAMADYPDPDNPCGEVENMPTIETEQQRDLFGGPPLPTRAPDAPGCVGGCDRELTPGDLKDTPEGPMCEKCIDDLYTVCADCNKMLRYDDWGECDDLRVGPDAKHRCCACDAAKYSLCHRCGCRTHRDDGVVRFNPLDLAEEYCESCWENRWFVCPVCTETFQRLDGYDIPGMPHCSGGLRCEECFETEYFRCSGCGASHPRDNMHGWEGDPYCEGCYGRADIWEVQPWSGRAITFDRVGSERCFGVELETSRSHDHRDLHSHTEWGCVYECSTPGREFISPILQGDEGFAEIKVMCDIAEEHRWRVDHSCGLHVHIDARDLSSGQLLQVAYAYRRSYPLWKKFVGDERSRNSMCGSPQYDGSDIREAEHIEDFVEGRDRFEYINWRSYLRHGSIEIRAYRGTLATREICNWVALHTRFVDAVKDLTYTEIDVALGAITRKNWVGLVNLIGDPNLLDYWRRQARSHGYPLPALWIGETEPTEPRRTVRRSATADLDHLADLREDREVAGRSGDLDIDAPERRRIFPEHHCGIENCRECNEEYGESYYE